MGVPVVTCPGRTLAGRHSTSHLTNAGFEQFVANDLAAYIELAVEWANQPSALAGLRAAMRTQMQDSPLCNASRFATDFVALLQSAWNSTHLS
jgi:predicted O-linked N-acetylglucosamine transferase (SPINDLY family)